MAFSLDQQASLVVVLHVQLVVVPWATLAGWGVCGPVIASSGDVPLDFVMRH